MVYLAIFVFLFVLSLLYAWVSLAPWVPTKSIDLEKIRVLTRLAE